MEPQINHPQPENYSRAPAETEIRQLMEDVSEAVRARDLYTILSAYDDNAIIYDVRDALKINKEGLRHSWQECFDSSTEFEYKIKDLKFQIDENVAFSFCLSHCTGKTVQGEAINIWLRVTTCYTKKNEKWLVFHEHVSVPGDFVSGKLLQNLKPDQIQRN